MRIVFLSILTLLCLLTTGCEVSIGDSDGGIDFGDGDGDGGDGDGDDADASAGDGDGDASGDGDGDTGGDGDGDGDMAGVAAADFADSLAVALCASQEACVGPAPLARLYNYNACADIVARSFAASELGMFADSVSAGRIVYDAAGAKTCLDDVAALECAWRSTRPPASCQAAIEGQAAAGAECNIDFDCDGDAFCAGNLCPGTCTPRVANGGGCSAGSQCQSGHVCEGDVCVPSLAKGAACDPNTDVCDWGTFCYEGTCQSERTLYTEAKDAPCDILDEILCDNTTGDALTCQKNNSDPGDSAGTCKPSVLAGEPCVLARPDQCPLEQYCLLADGLNGNCVPREQTGGPCASNERKTCATGLICVADECVSRSANGGPCFEDARCDSGVCNINSDTCEPALMCL